MFNFGGGSDDAHSKRVREEEERKKNLKAQEAKAKKYWDDKKEKKKQKRLKLKKKLKSEKMRAMLDSEFEAVMERRQRQKAEDQKSGPSLKRGNSSLLSQEVPGAKNGQQQQQQMGLRGASKLPNYTNETIEDRCGYSSSNPSAGFGSKLRRF